MIVGLVLLATFQLALSPAPRVPFLKRGPGAWENYARENDEAKEDAFSRLLVHAVADASWSR